uniref:Uncharacterized protein n=1 Tax=Chrysotila carterae TaxID=13221 RepID=A0A7S4BZU3_CHRCT
MLDHATDINATKFVWYEAYHRCHHRACDGTHSVPFSEHLHITHSCLFLQLSNCSSVNRFACIDMSSWKRDVSCMCVDTLRTHREQHGSLALHIEERYCNRSTSPRSSGIFSSVFL